MRSYSCQIPLLFLLAVLVGCGGGSSANQVAVTFEGGTPTSAAVQIGSGAFNSAPLDGNVLNVSIPDGTTKYAIAYTCPQSTYFAGRTTKDEFVLETTTADATAYTLSCLMPPVTGSATGNVDASAIPGATNVEISGNLAIAYLSPTSGSFTVTTATGLNDIAVVARDSSAHILAIKIIRNQVVPGVINGGHTITLGPSDMVTWQPISIANVPSGFVGKGSAEFATANGTWIPLGTWTIGNNPSWTSSIPSATTPLHAVLPSGAVAGGDFYSYAASALLPTSGNPSPNVQTTLITSDGGGPVTLSLPAPWSYSGPTPVALPTFTFNYPGFNDNAVIAQQGRIQWTISPDSPAFSGTIVTNTLAVTATASYQNGATTITVPDLSSISGFFAPALSGTYIGWDASIFGGKDNYLSYASTGQLRGTRLIAGSADGYTVP